MRLVRPLAALVFAAALAVVPVAAAHADAPLTITSQPDPVTEVPSGASTPYELFASSSNGFADVAWQQADSPAGPWEDVENPLGTVFPLSVFQAPGTVLYYRAVFTDGASTAISDVAEVDWVPGAATVSWSSATAAQLAGDVIHRSAVVDGAAPVSVRWQLGSTPAGPWNDVSGAVSTELTLTIDASMDGEYLRPVASNAYATDASGTAARIVVLPATPAAPSESDVATVQNNTVASVTVSAGTAVVTFIPAAASVIAPGTLVYGYAYSSPTPLGWATVQPDGTARWDVSSLPAGVHTLAAMIPLPFPPFGVTLTGAGTFTTTGTVGPPTDPGDASPAAATSTGPGDELASTGATDLGATIPVAVGMLALGALLVSRRRLMRRR